jgi:membrane-associated phospholipid phosphatase
MKRGGVQPSAGSRHGTGRLRELLRTSGRPRALLASAVVLVGGVALLVLVVWTLGLLAKSGPVARVDRSLYDSVVSHRTGWATTVMNQFTGIGSYAATGVVSVVAGVGLALWRRQALPLLLLATVPAERYLQQWIASLVHSPRPPAALSLGPAGTFPSGGSARVLLVGGMVAWLLVRWSPGRRLATVAWTVVALSALAEGWSRLYLGRHWVADILSGWVLGALLLAVLLATATVVAPPSGRPAWPRSLAADPDRAGAHERP